MIQIEIFIKTIVQECIILYLYPSVKFTLGLNRTGEAEGKIRHLRLHRILGAQQQLQTA